MSEDTLTIKTLQSHLIKTIVGSLVAALGVGLITSFSFYYNSQNRLDNHERDLSDLKIIVQKNTDAIVQTNNSTSISDVQVKELDRRMTSIEQSQKEIYNLCINIMNGQKELIRKSR